ncbi:hypothetical protein E2986_05480 [Frieseomelitta varia]|uniref:Cysteine dioxygenase n=1 Tax=Frieseomelitta varia TaxID=561572 RepID=A0A833RW28_9HYME|nr:hypothetical protein E2986_05480 [Frieseomelitta varia]
MKQAFTFAKITTYYCNIFVFPRHKRYIECFVAALCPKLKKENALKTSKELPNSCVQNIARVVRSRDEDPGLICVSRDKQLNEKNARQREVSLTLRELVDALHEAFKTDHVNIDDVQDLMASYKSNPLEWKKYAKFDRYR